MTPSPDLLNNCEDDSSDLATFGYKQELDRTLGSFSSFAAGFSYISIMTGLFQMFYLGFAAGGPSFIWSWPLVFFGQLLVALGFAELSAHYPLSGGVYQWSKGIGSPLLGWFVGWTYTACLIVSLAAVVLALQNSLPQISPHFQLIGDASNAHDSAMNAVIFGCGLVIFSTVINSIGVGILAKLNNIGVMSELLGIAILIICLACKAERGVSAVLFSAPRQEGDGFLGPLIASAALTASYVLYGFDTAGSLAEETSDPRRRAPWAILQALVAAATAGLFVLLFALMATKNLSAPELGRLDGGLPWIVKSVLGDTVGTLFLCDVIFAIIVCALAVHTGAVRLIFAMARDGFLPFSRALSQVSAKSKTPILPAILVGVLALIILAANIHLPKIIELVTMVAVLWANLAYMMITGALLLRRLRGWPGPDKTKNLFSLGRWGLPINVLAFIWSIFMVVNVGWPRESVYGPEWQHRFAPVVFTLILFAIGLLVRKFGASPVAVPRQSIQERNF
jgi:urea carboxylase system permease